MENMSSVKKTQVNKAAERKAAMERKVNGDVTVEGRIENKQQEKQVCGCCFVEVMKEGSPQLQ
jgi:hypothetical protein